MWPKSESVLNTQPISVLTKFELDFMITFLDNGRKPYSVILWPLEDKNLANVAQKQINFEHSANKCTPQVWTGLCEYFFLIKVGNKYFYPFSVIFLPLEAKIGPTWPKSESILNTYPGGVHHTFELDCLNTFWDNGRKATFWPIFSHCLGTEG